MKRSILAVLALTALPLTAQVEPFTCGTTPETNQYVSDAAAWSRARAENVFSKGLPQTTAALRDNVIYLTADDTNTPFRRPFDLEGRTLIFTPNGNGFSVRNVGLAAESDRGNPVLFTSGSEPSAKVSLDFVFPFRGISVRDIYIGAHNGIFLAPPQSTTLQQYGDLDLSTEREAVIAPLLTTSRSQSGTPSVRVKKRSDSATISWTGNGYDVQAVLSRTGEIRFSYVQVTSSLLASGLVITSGNESWRSAAGQTQSIDDAAGDPSSAAGLSRPAVDIVKMSLTNIAGTDLYEARIVTAGPIVVPPDSRITFTVTFGDGNSTRVIQYTKYSDGRIAYRLPVWGTVSETDAVTIDGSTISMRFLGEHAVATGTTSMRAFTALNGFTTDFTTTLLVTFPTTRPVRTDFSAITDTTIQDGPIAESFTLPILITSRVWEQVKQAGLGLRDEDIDGVAIYQTFLTDLVLYAAAYASGSNPGASGLSPGDTSATTKPRTPVLMHMNKVAFSPNRTTQGASHVVMHEFGHRWLLFVSVNENGTVTRVLNPVSAHPAQYVDTRAAFKVYTDTDTSVMGGGVFTENGDGSFTTPPYGAYGYSWLDLYLMGLADASEVPPFFYLADSQPALGGEYYAPPSQTFRATKHDLTLSQVIDATGVRIPAARDSQKHFRVVFVLLTEPGQDATSFDVDQMQLYRSLLEKNFVIATNGRASVATNIGESGGKKKRAVRP